MLRRLLLLVIVAVVAAPAAAADGLGPGVLQGGAGVLSPDGSLRYVALEAVPGVATTLAAVRTSDGTVLRTAYLDGQWGFPTMVGGTSLSRDGSTLVVAETSPGTPSKFFVYDPRKLEFREGILLEGTFTFDALSPDGSRLYLIQQMSETDRSRYVVRMYDLRKHRLNPGRIADRTQKSWIMHGYPVTRATSDDGRMVYTLYQNVGGYPFVHALDTVAGVAHCVGLPLSNDALYSVALRVHGSRVDVGRAYAIDAETWRLSRQHHGDFPWWTLLPALGLLPLAYALERRAQGRQLRNVLRAVRRLLHPDQVAERRDEHRHSEIELDGVSAEVVVAACARRSEDEVEPAGIRVQRPRVDVGEERRLDGKVDRAGTRSELALGQPGPFPIKNSSRSSPTCSGSRSVR